MTSVQELIQENMEKGLGKVEEYQLQFLVDEVTRLLNLKEKYEARFSRRLKRYGAKAHTSRFIKTGRRIIEFNEYSANDSWLWHKHSQMLDSNTHEVDLEKTRKWRREGFLKTIIHEIAHFKRCQRERRDYRKSNGVYYRWKSKHHHVKALYNLIEKLWQRLTPHLEYLINLDLSKTPRSPPKPEPTPSDIAKKKLVKVQDHVKRLQTRIKRLQTQLKKWQRRERYYQKQIVTGVLSQNENPH